MDDDQLLTGDQIADRVGHIPDLTNLERAAKFRKYGSHIKIAG